MRRRLGRALAVGLAVALGILVLLTVGSAGYTGTDTQAAAAVEERAPSYDQWIAPVWSPPGPLGEPLLFALQGGVGATVLWTSLDSLRNTDALDD